VAPSAIICNPQDIFQQLLYFWDQIFGASWYELTIL